MADRSQRTEQPTATKLQKARDEGNVARSKELPGALSLIGFLLFCHLGGGDWMGRMSGFLVDSLGSVARPDLTEADVVALTVSLTGSLAALLSLPLGLMVVAGLGGNLLQGAPPFTLKPLQPDLSKLNPFKGLKKLFRLKAWVEMAKSAAKMLLFTAIALSALRRALAEGVPGGPGAEGALAALFSIAHSVILRVALFALGLSLIDYLFTRFDYTRQLRMTKQEVKDERKQQDGDPVVKARIRSKQITMARSRMMADVPNATVVITNPTHFAVALRYVPREMDVPQVLAKGRGKVAERIRALAVEHDVPLVSDPPLARALYRSVKVGAYIPTQLFRAVAEILALILRNGPGRS